jgi:hypothetical protein
MAITGWFIGLAPATEYIFEFQDRNIIGESEVSSFTGTTADNRIVSGKAIDPFGCSTIGTKICFTNAVTGEIICGVVDEDGNFTVELPNGDYTTTVHGYNPVYSIIRCKMRRPIDVVLGTHLYNKESDVSAEASFEF